MVEWYRFDCPACQAAFDVDGQAREELRSVGCPECGATVTDGAFATRPPALAETP